MNKNPSPLIYQEKLKDNITLDPVEKYKKYGKFPFKLLVNIALIMTSSAIVIFFSKKIIVSTKAQEDAMKNIYFGADRDTYSINVYTATDFQDLITKIFDRSNNLNQFTFQKFSSDYLNANIEYFPRILESDQDMVYSYDIPMNMSFNQPFQIQNISSIQQFLQRCISFKLEINRIVYIDIEDNVNAYKCWGISFNFDLRKISSIEVKLTPHLISCSFIKGSLIPVSMTATEIITSLTQGHEEENLGLLLNICLLSLAIISLIFHFKHIFSVMNLYSDCKLHSQKRRMGNDRYRFQRKKNIIDDNSEEKKECTHLKEVIVSQKSWDELSISEKWLFFDLWIIFGITGNLIQGIASFNLIRWWIFPEEIEYQNYNNGLISFSCWFAWIYIIRYLEYYPKIAVFTYIFRKSFPQLLRFLIGFIPIFMAYVFLGLSVFWQYDNWNSFGNVFTILLALMAGDSVRDTMQDTKEAGLISLLYIISFLILFMLALHNMFISIICSFSYLWAEDTRNDISMPQKGLDTISNQNIYSTQKLDQPKSNENLNFQTNQSFSNNASLMKASSFNTEDLKSPRNAPLSPSSGINLKTNKSLHRRKTVIETELGFNLNLNQKEKKKFIQRIKSYATEINEEIDEMKSELKFYSEYCQLQKNGEYEIKKEYRNTIRRIHAHISKIEIGNK